VFQGYRVAPYGEREFDAMHLASAVLGQGQGSRLYRRLVIERELAAPGDAADIIPFRYTPSLMLVNTIAREGVSGDELEQAVLEETEALAGGITEEALDRARAVLERDHLQAISTPSGLADELGACTQPFGDPSPAVPRPHRRTRITAREVAGRPGGVRGVGRRDHRGRGGPGARGPGAGPPPGHLHPLRAGRRARRLHPAVRRPLARLHLAGPVDRDHRDGGRRGRRPAA